MDIEVLIFVILADFWIAALFILIGIVIGKAHSAYNQKSHKNVPEDVLQGDSDIRIYHRGDYHVLDCSAGSIHRKESDRRNMGYVREICDEALAAILRAMVVTGICQDDYEKDYLYEAADRLCPNDNGDNIAEGAMKRLDDAVDRLNNLAVRRMTK